jgi:AraC-like DNA-binding protein
MIFVAGIAISIFLTALLLFKRNKTTADKFLLAWFIIIALHQCFYYFYSSGMFRQYTQFIAIDMPFPLLHGPFLYLYAAALVNRLPKRRILLFANFIPVLICYAYIFNFYFATPEQKIYVMDHKGIGYETFMMLMQFAINISGIAYVAATLYLLWKHQKKILDQFSDIEKINLRWLQYLTYGIAIIWIPVIFGNDQYVFLTVVLFVAFIGFFGIRQTPIFAIQNHSQKDLASADFNDRDNLSVVNESSDEFNSPALVTEIAGSGVNAAKPEITTLEITEDKQRKYETSGLSDVKKKEIADGLTKHIDEEKLYLDPELSLDILARTLNIHPNYLSQFINEELGMTFYDYINSKRVTEFKKMVRQPDKSHFSMLGLALECGFNSKSSFNRNFKKIEGLTPSEYLVSVNS